MPRLRPGHACGPAPKGSHAPWSVLVGLPTSRVERRAGCRRIARDQLGESAQEQRADEHDPTGRDGGSAELHLARGDPRGDPRRGRQAQRLPHDVDRIGSGSGRVAGQPGEQEGAGGDGDLDARRQHGRQLLGESGRDQAARPGQSSSASRAARSARRTRLQRRGGRAAAMTGAERVDPAQHQVADSVTRGWVAGAAGRPRSWSEQRVVAAAASRRTASPGCGRARARPVPPATRRRRPSSAARHLRRVRRLEDVCPDRVSPRLPDRSPLRLTSPGKSKRSGSVSTCSDQGGGGGEPWPVPVPRGAMPPRGAERTAPSWPPADSTLSMCITVSWLLPRAPMVQLRGGPGRQP